MLRLLLAPLVAAVCTVGAAPLASPAPVASDAPALRDAPGPEPVVGAALGPTTAPTSSDTMPTSGDAVPTSSDACPDQEETRNGFADDDGCPDEVPPELAAIVGVVTGITFDLQKDTMKLATSRPTLDRLIETLTRHPAVAIEIAVHSDRESESGHYARCLTCKRAEAIARYLVSRGIAPERVRHAGYAADRPIADHRTAEGRRKNRRIEIHLLSDGVAVAAPTGCLDRRTLLVAGTHQDCYPYVCRAGRCLTRCDDRSDCAGAQVPAELASQGWPLECMPGGDCTPMPPDKVH